MRYLGLIGYLVLAGAVIAALYLNYSLATSTNDALCTFQADLERRVETSEDYLAEHPEGIPSLGFSAAEIQNQINNQRRTLDSLSALDC